MLDLSAAVMVPVHDHYTEMRGEIVDEYGHSPFCSGECEHGGACQLVGMYCDQRCHGCSPYNSPSPLHDGYFKKDPNGYTLIVPWTGTTDPF